MYIHLKLTDVSIFYMCIVFIDFQKHVYLHLTPLRKLSVFRSSPMNIRIIREYLYSTPLSILTHARNFFAKLRNKHEDLMICSEKIVLFIDGSPIYTMKHFALFEILIIT